MYKYPISIRKIIQYHYLLETPNYMQMRYQYRPTKMTTNKKASTIMFSKDLEKLEISHIAGRSINWHNSLYYCLEFFAVI